MASLRRRPRLTVAIPTGRRCCPGFGLPSTWHSPELDTAIDKFVYFYGNLVAEDFMEIFLMAANGYGYGAMKLLRSMYEHTCHTEVSA
jgi:hypothetical protein